MNKKENNKCKKMILSWTILFISFLPSIWNASWNYIENDKWKPSNTLIKEVKNNKIVSSKKEEKFENDFDNSEEYLNKLINSNNLELLKNEQIKRQTYHKLILEEYNKSFNTDILNLITINWVSLSKINDKVFEIENTEPKK